MEQFSLVPGTPVQQLIFPRGKANPLTLVTPNWGLRNQAFREKPVNDEESSEAFACLRTKANMGNSAELLNFGILSLSTPKSQRFLRFLRLRCPIADPRNRAISETRDSNDALRFKVRWKVASDLRFRAAISEPKTPSRCGISGDLAPSTRKSLAIAIVQFWCTKAYSIRQGKVPQIVLLEFPE